MLSKEKSLLGVHLVAIWEIMKLVRLRLSNFIEAVLGASGKMLEMSPSSKLGIEPVSTSFAAFIRQVDSHSSRWGERVTPSCSHHLLYLVKATSNVHRLDEPLLHLLVVVECSSSDDVSHLVS
jgi:hypothetical protein